MLGRSTLTKPNKEDMQAWQIVPYLLQLPVFCKMGNIILVRSTHGHWNPVSIDRQQFPGPLVSSVQSNQYNRNGVCQSLGPAMVGHVPFPATHCTCFHPCLAHSRRTTSSSHHFTSILGSFATLLHSPSVRGRWVSTRVKLIPTCLRGDSHSCLSILILDLTGYDDPESFLSTINLERISY